MKNSESKNFTFCVHVLFIRGCFFDSKNGPQAMRVQQTAPQYPQVYGKTMREPFECSKFLDISKQRPILTKCPPMQKSSLAHRRRRITLTSIHYRGRYALRVIALSPRGRAFKLFAASAERKWIFEVENTFNPAFFLCFSWFSYFSNFGCFSGRLTLNFESVAWFPARGCS